MDTGKVLQFRKGLDEIQRQTVTYRQALMALAGEHRDTVMIGRTLGQHALPITFGKKVSVWAAQNGRPYVNVEAQHGHREEQARMIRALAEVLAER